jgi:hypothetical protein
MPPAEKFTPLKQRESYRDKRYLTGAGAGWHRRFGSVKQGVRNVGNFRLFLANHILLVVMKLCAPDVTAYD